MKTLNEKSDVKALAKEIIDKCKLIHPSKILEVEQLLFYLQNRKDAVPAKGTFHESRRGRFVYIAAKLAKNSWINFCYM